MSSSARILNPSEAAKRLGVSTKALRLYEQRGLVAPVRTAAGWRVYGPAEMVRAAEIVALRGKLVAAEALAKAERAYRVALVAMAGRKPGEPLSPVWRAAVAAERDLAAAGGTP